MADVSPTGIVDTATTRRIYYPGVNMQSSAQTARDLISPDPPLISVVPILAGSVARFVIPSTTEKWTGCQVFVRIPPTLIFNNTPNGVNINMQAEYLGFQSNILFDGKPYFTTFYRQTEQFFVPGDVKEILLPASEAKLKVHLIDLLPEVGVNNTKIDFPLNTAGLALIQVFFQPSLLFFK